MERLPPKDGYEWTGRTPTEIRLVDPLFCPAGHPADLVRSSHINCERHRVLHPEWWCSCGQKIWRFEGAFVGELPCR